MHLEHIVHLEENEVSAFRWYCGEKVIWCLPPRSLEPASIIKSERLAKYMAKNQEIAFLNQNFLPM